MTWVPCHLDVQRPQVKDGGNVLQIWRVAARIQSTYPARNLTHAHVQDFAISDAMLLAILKAYVPQHVNKQHTIGSYVFTYT